MRGKTLCITSVTTRFSLANTNYRNYANLIESNQTICDTSAHLFLHKNLRKDEDEDEDE